MLEAVNLFGIEENLEDTKYSLNLGVPQYVPNADKPKVDDICDSRKYEELIRKINASTISEEDKKFLKMAATRHLVFNYAKIADYYANSPKEVQELMEESALVIIDFDDALAYGYVELSDKIRSIAKKSNSYKKKAEKYALDMEE